MIGNIIDKRTNPYDVICDVCFQPSSDFNHLPNASQFEVHRNNIIYKQRFAILLHDAISIANEFEYPVTITIYNVDTLATRSLK